MKRPCVWVYVVQKHILYVAGFSIVKQNLNETIHSPERLTAGSANQTHHKRV